MLEQTQLRLKTRIVSYLIGTLLLAFNTFLFIICSLALFARIDVQGWHTLIAGFLATCCTVHVAARSNMVLSWRLIVLVGFLALSIFGITLTSSLNVFDISYDGQWYHAQAVYALSNGWNPIADPPVESIWVNSYPKAIWIIRAAIYDLTGRFEAIKVVNMLLAISAFAFGMGSLLEYEHLSIRNSLILALMTAANPVTIPQLYTGYVDGLLASILTIVVFLTIRCNFDTLAVFGFVSCIILGINTKFTGLIYVSLIMIGPVLLLLLQHSESMYSVFRSFVLSFIISIFVLGFNPYVTNTVRHGTPFYPALGSDLPIIADQIPDTFEERSNLFRLGLSLFSQSQLGRSAPVLKIPFDVSYQEVVAFQDPDVRIGGFGPLFSGALILSGSILFLVIFQNSDWEKNPWPIWITLLLIIISIIWNPAAWWARLVPQIWLVNALIILIGCLSPKIQIRVIAVLTAIIMLINSTSVTISSTQHMVSVSNIMKHELQELAEQPIPILVRFSGYNTLVMRIHFDEYQIPYVESEELYCLPKRPSIINEYYETQYCLGPVYSP